MAVRRRSRKSPAACRPWPPTFRGVPRNHRRCGERSRSADARAAGNGNGMGRVVEHPRREQPVRIGLAAVSTDGAIVKVHPDGTGARKNGPQTIGESRGDGSPGFILPRMPERRRHSRRPPDRPVMHPGNAGRHINRGVCKGNCPVDGSGMRDDGTRRPAPELGFGPVVPPPGTRPYPRICDRETYGPRNGVGRLFRRPKGFCRILPRFGKFDAIFPASSCSFLSSMHCFGVNTL